MHGISIILCTYNGEKRLPKTLQHLFNQTFTREIPWQIIIVDNNSTDGTKDTAYELHEQSKSKVAFQVVKESKSGLSYARAKGIAEAEGKYILFCDDDNWLEADYIQKAFDIMENDPKIGMLGGKGIAISDVKLPLWFEKYQSCYAVGEQNNFNGDITSNKGSVYGAGCILRKEIWNNIMNSDVDLLLTGRKGNKIISGEDSEMCYLIAASGYQIHYTDKLKFKHFIDHARLTIQYLKKFYQSQAISFEIIYSYKSILNNGNRNRGWPQFSMDFVKSITQVIALSMIPPNIRSKNPDLEVRYSYHRSRIADVYNNQRNYQNIHNLVKQNIDLAQSAN